MRPRSLALTLAPLAVVAGCASTSPRGPVDDTAALVARRNGAELAWIGDDGASDAARREVSSILGRDLDLEGAVRVTLLANHDLQARYEELAIGQADLVQAWGT